MKKNGFTLIELLGSITLLAAVALLAFPAILNLIGGSQKEINQSKKSYVESAAADYVTDNENEFQMESNLNKNILVKDLINNGYISDKSIDEEKDNVIYNGCVNVTTKTITELNKTYTRYNYEFKTTCS